MKQIQVYKHADFDSVEHQRISAIAVRVGAIGSGNLIVRGDL